MRDGTSQARRRPLALADHYVDADEQDLAHLMTLALDYAQQMRFMEVGANGRQAATGSWRPYFSGDETMAMAGILAMRPDRLRARFEHLHANALVQERLAAGPLAREAMPSRIVDELAGTLKGWADTLLLGESAVGRDLGLLIAGLLAKIDFFKYLTNIHRYHSAAQAGEGGEPAALYGGAEEAAKVKAEVEAAMKDKGTLRSTPLFTIRALFHSLLKAVEMSQAGAAERLPASLKNGGHDAGAGLLLAFVHLYRQAQAKANRFTAKHLDFYYEQVLRMKPNGFVCDSTILVFEPTQPGVRVTIDSGAEFLAPIDKSKPDIEFVADHELVVGDAAVAALYTFYLERNGMNSPERELSEFCGGELQHYPTGAWLSALPIIPAEGAVDRTRLVSYPLFGAARDGVQSRQGERARLGFALACNVLLLHEGTRRLSITLRFGAAALQPGQPEETAVRTLRERLAPLADLLGTSDSDAFHRVFRNMFNIALTGPGGWLEVGEYSPAVNKDTNELTINIILGDEQPAIVPYQAALHGEQYDADTPLIRFELNRYGYLYPYGLLRDLPVSEVLIGVDVSGHRQLMLYNSVGQLSATGPFNPFGPLPEIGSYLIVGSAETAAKHLTHFELELEWGGLPADPGGFRRYYGGYRETPGYGDVKAALTALSDGKWLPQDPAEQPQVTLLDSRVALRKVDRIGHAETLVADRALPHARQLPLPPAAGQFAYTPGAKGGFFKFTLASPAFAFGHRAYPLDLAETLSRNSRERIPRLRRALPNPPYTPLVNAVAVNYRATATLSADPKRGGVSGKIIRLHPLGWDVLGANEAGALLLPRIGYSGNLLIGLRAAGLDGALTLYFHLREDSRAAANDEGRKLCWFYLTGNVWKPLEARRVLADSTRGFLRPGIVKLDIPAEISKDNTICTPGLYWLKVSAETGLPDFCSVFSVHTQALLVSRRAPAAGDPDTPVLIPAGTIRRPRKAIAGLAKVTQIVSSFGGRPAEDKQQLRVRTAERLKHKQRAIVADDYERLILERFPEIDKVKCFPNLSMKFAPDGTVYPGHVLIVGLPRLTSRGHLKLLPTLNGYLIGQVGAFITPLASPAVSIEVRNPVYQQIQVRCTVRLAPGSDHGRCLNQLDEEISNFISPWHEGGNTSHFGWCLHQHEIESFIRSFPFVEGVTQFSMLSIIGRDNHDYTLYDTAAQPHEARAEVDVTPKFPWAIVTPIPAGHVIRSTAGAQEIAATRTGINDLGIGSTFIISPSRPGNGKTE